MRTHVLLDDERPLPSADVPAVEFSLLGPVEARLGSQFIDVGPARQRCVLAVLLLEANHCVSADQLVDRVWGGCRLPHRPRNAVHTYMSLLRGKLAAASGLAIVRQPNGYMVSMDARLVDVHAFRALIKQARGCGRDAVAIEQFERALGLWQGEAFGRLDTPWLSSVRTTLDKERVAAERDLADIQLRQGQHGVLLARLAAWAAQQPLDERLAGQLMLALYRSGRQAEALANYQHTRRLLAGELGIDVSRVLQELHQQILTADPALALGASRSGGARSGDRSPGCTFAYRSGPRCLTRRR